MYEIENQRGAHLAEGEICNIHLVIIDHIASSLLTRWADYNAIPDVSLITKNDRQLRICRENSNELAGLWMVISKVS